MSEKIKKEKKGEDVGFTRGQYKIPHAENGEEKVILSDFGKPDKIVMNEYVYEGVSRLLLLFTKKDAANLSEEEGNKFDEILNRWIILPAMYQGLGISYRDLNQATEDVGSGRLRTDEVLDRLWVRVLVHPTKKVSDKERELIKEWYNGEEGDITHLGRIFGRSHNTIAAVLKDKSTSPPMRKVTD